jgi:F420-dependent oxidoreductase-like protein
MAETSRLDDVAKAPLGGSIGVVLPAGAEQATAANQVDALIALGQEGVAVGLGSLWLSQQFDHDALSVAAILGHAVPDIALGTSVVPIYPRHPMVVFSQAQTAQAASHGRFTLGIGFGPPQFAEAFGVPFDRPIRHLREYLTALGSLFSTGSVNLVGETLRASTRRPATLAGATPPVSVVVAAMGPQALRVTGELADGTVPYLAGPKTVGELIVPTINDAARAAGRPAPRIVVCLPGVVTADVDSVRVRAAEQMAFYLTLPSVTAVLAREGVSHPAELAVIGDEEALAAAIEQYFEAGATEIAVAQTGMSGDEDRRRTWGLLGELNRSRVSAG